MHNKVNTCIKKKNHAHSMSFPSLWFAKKTTTMDNVYPRLKGPCTCVVNTSFDGYNTVMRGCMQNVGRSTSGYAQTCRYK